MSDSEPIVKGGQGRSDSEVEQSGEVVGTVCLMSLAFFVGLLIGWLAAGGMG